MKISSWNFQHLFITSLCQIGIKILVTAQSACQPRPITAKTLNVSSDHICWDILKRKKLGGFQTIPNDWLEGIFDIFKKTAFWNFLIELWVHPNAVHGSLNLWKIDIDIFKYSKKNFKIAWSSASIFKHICYLDRGQR